MTNCHFRAWGLLRNLAEPAVQAAIAYGLPVILFEDSDLAVHEAHDGRHKKRCSED
jgi:hypothetical protein